MPLNMNLNFVKFSRGSAAAYTALKNSNRLDPETLYFIYDSTAPQNGGLLYLGDVLIGGTSTAAIENLNDLSDVNFNSNLLVDGMILQYNSTVHKWEAVAGSDLLPVIQSGSKNSGETDQQALARIDSAPLEGDIVFINNVPYIYNGSSWQLLVGQDLEDRVTALETGLQAVDGKIATAISNANHLTYTVVSALPTVANAVENTVYLVGDSTTQGDNKYEEYLLVNGAFENIGTFGADLSNYVTTTSFNSAVGNLQSSIGALQSNLNNYVLVSDYEDEVGDIGDLRTFTGINDITLVDGVIDLYERLIWNNLDTNG